MHEHVALCNAMEPFHKQLCPFGRCGLGSAGRLLSEGRPRRERMERLLQCARSARPAHLQEGEAHLHRLGAGEMA